MSKITAFLRDVRIELSKVQWPTRTETTKYTLIVIGMGIIAAIFLGAFDTLFKYLLQTFIIK